MSLDWEKIDEMVEFCSQGRDKSTRTNYLGAIANLRLYCDQYNVTSWLKFDVRVAIGFVQWLKRKYQSSTTVRVNACAVFRLLEALQQVHPTSISEHFVYPSAHIPKAGRMKRNELNGEDLKRLVKACLDDLPAKDGSPASLIPALVLLCIRTGMNATSAYLLRRDCLTPHPHGGMYLVWGKPRAGGELKQWHQPQPWGAIELVQHLQGLTSWEMLFGGRKNWAKPLNEWRARHKLPEFRIDELRPAAASLVYELTGEVSRVQQFLMHSKVSTTLMYLHESVLAPRREQQIANLQKHLFQVWGGGK